MFVKRSECLNIFGTSITGKSEISEEMKMKIGMGNLCCYCGLQYTLSLELQTGYQKLKYKT
jgi:hypothetical protein